MDTHLVPTYMFVCSEAGMVSDSHTGRLTFKDSPFYTVIEPLTSASECKGGTLAVYSYFSDSSHLIILPVREQTRDSVELKVILTPTVATRLQADPNIRVMVYCAADTGLNQYTKSDIAFPHQVELKANLDEVKANLRGLKNKPGTTRPADVTQYIRKKPGYPNNIVMTYALTQKASIGPPFTPSQHDTRWTLIRGSTMKSLANRV